MKILVVYYSRTGLTKKVALQLAIELGAEAEEIIDKKNRAGVLNYMICGREAMKKILAEIESPKNDPTGYDLVLIGTPVWAGTMASPVRSYLSVQKDKLKRVAFFVTQGGAGANRTIDNMADLIGLKSAASLTVLSKEVVKDDYREKLTQFISEIKK